MKKLLLSVVIGSSTFANFGLLDFSEGVQSETEFNRIIKDATHKSTVTLDLETVRCSALGYGRSELKISIPTLGWKAVLDHSNQDGRGPCVTAGSFTCPGFSFPDPSDAPLPPSTNGIPDILINLDKPREEVDVRVVLKEEFYINTRDNKCHRTIRELVETNVRGIKFTHNRAKGIGELSVEECVAIREKL